MMIFIIIIIIIFSETHQTDCMDVNVLKFIYLQTTTQHSCTLSYYDYYITYREIFSSRTKDPIQVVYRDNDLRGSSRDCETQSLQPAVKVIVE